MGLIDEALDRQAAEPPPRQIDYARMNKVLPKQKAELTRAKNAYRTICDGLDAWDRSESFPLARARENLARVIKRHVAVWNEIGAWPDGWHTWQVALDDTLGWTQHIDIGDL